MNYGVLVYMILFHGETVFNFMCIFSNGNRHNILYIYLQHLPRSFAKSNINMNCRKQILTLVTNGGQSWPVKLSCNLQSMKSNMYGGLSNFLKENFVRLGNLCTFELIDKKQMVFRVYIHRGKDDIPHADSHDFGCKKTCSTTISNAPRPGSEFAAKHPFFQATINKFTLLYKRLVWLITCHAISNVFGTSFVHLFFRVYHGPL